MLEDRSNTSELVHFIEMYDNLIGLETHCLNAYIFEGKEYILKVLEQIKQIEAEGSSELIEDCLKRNYWSKKEERNIGNIQTKLRNALTVENET